MSLQAAAAAIGAPEELVMRSARARSEASGTSVDDILAAWAGGTAAPTGSAAPAPAPADAAVTPEPEPLGAEEMVAEASAAPTPVEAAPTASAPAVIAASPVPETVTVDEAQNWDQVTAVRAAGLKERTKSVIPTWMVALFTFVPLFAVGYITVNSGGPACGDAGQLAVDFRNDLVNCDLTAYEGLGGPGAGEVNYVAIGSVVYGQCASCHGGNGEGGSGPQLSGGAVATTFSSCTDHITWVEIGSNGWSSEFGPTYGDTNTPIAGGMSAWAGTLTEEELVSVVVYERVVHGLLDQESVLEDCGLVTAEEDTEGEPGEEPASDDGGEEAPADEEAPATDE